MPLSSSKIGEPPPQTPCIRLSIGFFDLTRPAQTGIKIACPGHRCVLCVRMCVPSRPEGHTGDFGEGKVDLCQRGGEGLGDEVGAAVGDMRGDRHNGQRADRVGWGALHQPVCVRMRQTNHLRIFTNNPSLASILTPVETSKTNIRSIWSTGAIVQTNDLNCSLAQLSKRTIQRHQQCPSNLGRDPAPQTTRKDTQ